MAVFSQTVREEVRVERGMLTRTDGILLIGKPGAIAARSGTAHIEPNLPDVFSDPVSSGTTGASREGDVVRGSVFYD